MTQESAFERFCSFDALYDASYKVCRNVRWKDSTINFEESRIETVLKTEEDLRNNEYQQLLFSCFSIIERGKPRDIRACHINDRLVHNALSDNVLTPDIAPKFVYDNCASLKNKGIDFALLRAKYQLQAAHRTYGLGNDFYALRIDIRKYFDSIDHAALKTLVREVVEDDDVYQLICYIIDSFAFKPTKDKIPVPGKIYYIAKRQKYKVYEGSAFKLHHHYYEFEEKSLGLGSQTSQFLALLALNKIDHFIKEQLHIQFFGRYMDDLYIFHNDREYLIECKNKIEEQLATIGLSMNQKKTTITCIRPLEKGEKRQAPFKYLKWNFYLTTTNHIIQLPFKEKIAKQRRKLRKMHDLFAQKEISEEDILTSYMGWREGMQKGTTFHIVQKMDNYFQSLFKGVEIRNVRTTKS